MSSISAFSNSRGNYLEMRRPPDADHKAEKLAEKAERNTTKEAEKLAKAQANAGKDRIDVSRKPEATEKPLSDVELGRRLDELDSKYSKASKRLAAILANQGNTTEFEALGSKFDSFADQTTKQFDDVDRKLHDLTSQLGDKLDSVAGDLSTVISELTQIIKRETTGSPYLSDAAQNSRSDISEPSRNRAAGNDAETNAWLEKLDEVTEQLRMLSQPSSELSSALNEQLNGLGDQFETIINKLDLLGNGQNLSLRTIRLFDAAAKAGNRALDQLIGVVGPNSSGRQLRSIQSHLQSVSSRFGGGQPPGGLSLLA